MCIRDSYTGIWNVEKVLYAINDFNLPFPVTFTQITWFVITEFIIILFGDIPPLSMIEGAFLKYFGIPVALTWFMSQKTFDGKKPYSFLKSQITYAPVSYTHLDVYKRQVVELVNPVADTVSRKTYTGADVDWYVKAEDIVLKNKGNQNAGNPQNNNTQGQPKK